MNLVRANASISLARSIASQSDRKFKHVSLVFHKKQLVAVGTNVLSTHPVATQYGYRFDNPHSELKALMGTKHRKHLTLINYRFNKRGELKNSRPCKICSTWVPLVFDNVYYSNEQGKMVKL